MTLETKDYVTLFGILITLAVAIVNLVITIKNSTKNTFINSVTASRIKYIQQLRESISRYCALINSYSSRISKLTYEQLWELHKEADTLKYVIRLYLNPEDEYWDSRIIGLTNEIMLKTDKDPKEVINELITITQYLLKLEWEGAKKEAESGMLSPSDKKELYDKYVELHKKANLQISK